MLLLPSNRIWHTRPPVAPRAMGLHSWGSVQGFGAAERGLAWSRGFELAARPWCSFLVWVESTEGSEVGAIFIMHDDGDEDDGMSRDDLDIGRGTRYPSSRSASGNYSYVSNTSSIGDSKNSDSFMPEPKKRLFDTDDDFELSSPSKTTKML
nr:hypothetical protein BaRGS_025080 [Batillaria attramentaria]